MGSIEDLGLTLAHLGVNCNDGEKAADTAQAFAALFGQPVKDGNSSIFVGKEFEIMKKPFKGMHGHIALRAPDLDLAIQTFTDNGFKFDMSTAKKDDHGNTKSIYLLDEIGGFAIHLV